MVTSFGCEETGNTSCKMADKTEENDGKKKVPEKPFVARSATELQRMKLEKLMKDPDKTVSIPDTPKQWKPSEAPEFIRFVMGSSAGAGSGEFHVYRSTRRKEYNRVAYIEKIAEQQELDDKYHRKLEENKTLEEDRTAKKRTKRLKRKQKKLNAKRKKVPENKDQQDDKQEELSSDEDKDSEEEEEPHFVIGGK